MIQNNTGLNLICFCSGWDGLAQKMDALDHTIWMLRVNPCFNRSQAL